MVEAVEEEGDGFRFFFEDAGQLGRPIIQIEGVTFGYGEKGANRPLFRNVHMSIDQSSRIALVFSFSIILITPLGWTKWSWKKYSSEFNPK